MTLSDVGRKDPAMIGTSGFPRAPLDHYPTPLSAFKGLPEIYGDDLPAMFAWEPFCGTMAISGPLSEYARGVISTDIVAYEGFDPDMVVDFFNIYPDGEEFEKAVAAWEAWIDENTNELGECPEAPPYPVCMADIEQIKGVRPDAIITNPPYGKDAEKAARHALKLMQPEKGFVAFLCRHEWDCAKSRKDLFDHPAFMGKITLRHRPRWIAGTTGAPRFSYAWFIWDWTRLASHKPELFYAQ